MGCVESISYDRFPKQGTYLNKKCKVCFFYGDETISGIIVRDDMEQPFLTIIRLDDGRHVLSTECQYSPEL